ncbi:MAG: hypothetical protein NXI31_21490 [bacterium]|nr:hypothetical protein [bacterium]
MANRKQATLSLSGIAIAVLVLVANWWLDLGLFGDQNGSKPPAPEPTQKSAPADHGSAKGAPAERAPAAGPGFTSPRSLERHFEKHGHEFDVASAAEYLAIAQRLRDAPVGGDVLEERRRDGVVTRFDRDTGAFVAFNADRTIRTLFKPDDGERYFKRQARRED